MGLQFRFSKNYIAHLIINLTELYLAKLFLLGVLIFTIAECDLNMGYFVQLIEVPDHVSHVDPGFKRLVIKPKTQHDLHRASYLLREDTQRLEPTDYSISKKTVLKWWVPHPLCFIVKRHFYPLVFFIKTQHLLVIIISF
jgi:hypothetical protein